MVAIDQIKKKEKKRTFQKPHIFHMAVQGYHNVPAYMWEDFSVLWKFHYNTPSRINSAYRNKQERPRRVEQHTLNQSFSFLERTLERNVRNACRFEK